MLTASKAWPRLAQPSLGTVEWWSGCRGGGHLGLLALEQPRFNVSQGAIFGNYCHKQWQKRYI